MQPSKGYDIKQEVRRQILALASDMEPQSRGKLPSETSLADRFVPDSPVVGQLRSRRHQFFRVWHFSNPSVLLAAIGLVASCIIRCGKYLFTEERSKKMLPSIATVVLTILSLLQCITASEY